MSERPRESVDFVLQGVGRQQGRPHHALRRRDAAEFRRAAKTITYARQGAAETGKDVVFRLTTNATLLKPGIIEFLAEERVGVTISIDGPKEVQDKFRVFHNGTGSYDVVAPKIKELIRRHRSRPIGARVTLTSGKMDVKRIYQHLTEEMGFWEVGFAPVTTSPNRAHAISDGGYDEMLGQFRDLAFEFLEATVAGRHHGFSNVKETLEELHKGVSKAFPCGAGLGACWRRHRRRRRLCHRFAGSDSHQLGTVRDGIDRAGAAGVPRAAPRGQQDRLPHVLGASPVLRRLLSRSAHPLRRHDAREPALLQLIRGWTEVSSQVYGELSERNPAFLAQFDDKDMKELVS